MINNLYFYVTEYSLNFCKNTRGKKILPGYLPENVLRIFNAINSNDELMRKDSTTEVNYHQIMERHGLNLKCSF